MTIQGFDKDNQWYYDSTRDPRYQNDLTLNPDDVKKFLTKEQLENFPREKVNQGATLTMAATFIPFTFPTRFEIYFDGEKIDEVIVPEGVSLPSVVEF